MDIIRFAPILRSVTVSLHRGLLCRTGLLAPSLALVVALVCGGPALSAVRVGTNGSETLVGTVANDQITGKGGSDVLRGRAGSDTYFFAKNWGTDTLVEKAGEGSDTVDFHAVTAGPVRVILVPEWVDVDPSSNLATGPGGEVRFAYTVNGQTVQSAVENVIG